MTAANKVLKGLAIAFAGVVLLVCGLPLLLILDDDQAASASCPLTGTPSAAAAAGRFSPLGTWDKDQVANAATIVAVGKQQGLPARGWVIAVGTAMQESQLENLGHLGERNDHDSQGLFQQRPSQGWGTVSQIRDPVHASTTFYAALQRVPRWETLPLTVAAQKVQRSAFPDHYAKWEDDAEKLVAHVAGVTTISELPGASLAECEAPAQVSAQGWVRPVDAPVGSPYGPRNGRLHAGVDLSSKRNTVIRAASGGKVLWSGCDPGTGNCNVDGSPQTSGCGFYVDILHADEVGTRYCHLVREPDVAEGDTVNAGDQIGLMGTSGRSSGVHLHFEVHLQVCGGDGKACDLAKDNSTDPVQFMRDVAKAPLSEKL